VIIGLERAVNESLVLHMYGNHLMVLSTKPLTLSMDM